MRQNDSERRGIGQPHAFVRLSSLNRFLFSLDPEPYSMNMLYLDHDVRILRALCPNSMACQHTRTLGYALPMHL